MVRACAAGIVLLAPLSALDAQPGEEVVVTAPNARAASLNVAAKGPVAVVTWIAGTSASNTMMATVTRDSGRQFTAPMAVGPAAPATSLQKAAIAISDSAAAGSPASPLVRVAWPASQDGRNGIMLAQSRDGTSFTRTFMGRSDLPAGAAVTALALGASGRVHVLWLAGNRLFYARGEGSSLERARLLDSAASRCRITALATGPGSAVSVFWHRTFGQGDEEFAFAGSSTEGDRFDPVVRVSRERWGFQSCPGASPSLTVDASGALRFAFQAVIPGAPPRSTFFVDRTTDRRTFRPRTFLEVPGFTDTRNPALAPDGEGGLSLVWDGMRNARRYVMIRHSLGAPGLTSGIEADWMRPSPPIVLDQSGRGGPPAVTRVNGGMLAVWVTGTSQATRLASRRLTIDQLCGLAP
jgi:hypothetical protein